MNFKYFYWRDLSVAWFKEPLSHVISSWSMCQSLLRLVVRLVATILGEGSLLTAEIWPVRHYFRTCLASDLGVRGSGKYVLLCLVSINYTSLVYHPQLIPLLMLWTSLRYWLCISFWSLSWLDYPETFKYQATSPAPWSFPVKAVALLFQYLHPLPPSKGMWNHLNLFQKIWRQQGARSAASGLFN